MIPPPLPDRSRGLTTAQLILGILGITFSMMGLFVLTLLIVAGPMIPSFDSSQTNQLIFLGWIVGLLIVLTIPSLVLSIRHLRGLPPRRPLRKTFLIASAALLLIPLILLVVNQANELSGSTWWTAPLNILLVLIPIWWFFELGRLRLNGGSTQRLWGLSNFSMYLTLSLVIVVEIILLGIGLLAVSMWLIQQPDFLSVIQQFQHQLQVNPLDIPDISIESLPILQSPELIIALIVGVSVIIPLTEEALKPLALWVLSKRTLTPAEGFVAGMVCGATFALIESAFSIGSVPSEIWGLSIASRAGTGLLHIVTAGVNGWALVTTWKDSKWLRIALTYVLTVLVHGLWNFFAILMGLSHVGTQFSLPINPGLVDFSIWGLAGISLLLIVTLILMNLMLRNKASPQFIVPPPIPVVDDPGVPPSLDGKSER